MATTLKVKRICVFNKTTGMLYRLDKLQASELVRGGEYAFVRKGKLKCFLNREVKLTRNQKALEGVDMSKTNKQGNKFVQREDGRVYAKLGIKPFNYLIVKYPN